MIASLATSGAEPAGGGAELHSGIRQPTQKLSYGRSSALDAHSFAPRRLDK